MKTGAVEEFIKLEKSVPIQCGVSVGIGALSMYKKVCQNLAGVSITTLIQHVAWLLIWSNTSFLFINGLHRKLLAGSLKTFRIQAEAGAARLSKGEIRRLVTSIDLNGRNGYHDLAIVQLFLQCGLRVGELVRLSRDDVILPAGIGASGYQYHCTIRQSHGY
jgi:integrase